MQILIDIGLFLIYCAATTLLIAWAWKFWMLYINNKFIENIKWIMLEIRLPREINKSPEASEFFLKSIPDGGGLGNWYKENWMGNMPAYSSLEIVSLEGIIHFYIRTEKKHRAKIEAAIYAQYPTVEIMEVEDYTKKIPYKYVRNAKENPAFVASDWKLSKKGIIDQYGDEKENKIYKLEYSGDMYPIKTYKDWGLDKDPKEMYKHDPLTHVLETMGSIGKGEYMGYQILIRDAGKWNNFFSIKKEDKDKKVTLEEAKTFSEIVKFEIDKYKKKWSLNEKDKTEKDEWGEVKGKLTKDAEGKEEFKAFKYLEDKVISKSIPVVEREEDSKKNLELIQRKISKQQVIAYIRTIYIADKMGDGRGGMLMNLFKGFNEEGFNTLAPNGDTSADPFDYPWQNTMKRLIPWRTESLYGAYMGRGGFFGFSGGMSKETKKFLDITLFNSPNIVRKIYSTFHNILLHPFNPTVSYNSGFILNVEELATLFHFPGEVAATPTIPRIDSTKSSSPSNLPI